MGHYIGVTLDTPVSPEKSHFGAGRSLKSLLGKGRITF
jgi:hypothetical protein